METVTITIDEQKIQAEKGISLLKAALNTDIYIPNLCSHPNLPPSQGLKPVDVIYRGDEVIENADPQGEFKGCQLCVVKIEGMEGFPTSCTTEVMDGMVVYTNSEEIQALRRDNLLPILTKHPHACLTCAQKEGCSREPCSTNVPTDERCCPKLNRCELQRVAEYVGIKGETPRWIPTQLPVFKEDPLFERDYNLCIGCTRCVRACGDYRGIEALGFVFDGEGNVIVGTVSPGLRESACKFCTACVEVCPTGTLMDREVRLAEREADLVPCTANCPVGIDVPEYVRLVGQGRYGEAVAVVREKAPFPRVLGHICFHSCETACRRDQVNDPISICALKRFAAENDTGTWKERSKMAGPSGRKVAVVGGGPAGLTASFYLKKVGHEVVLYESEDEIGGMMWLGIPEYRLPREVLRKDIDEILELGIEVRGKTSLGNGLSLNDLKGQYDALFLPVGAQLSRKLDIEGVGLKGVLWGVEFLKDVKHGKAVRVGDRVVVIGGGNVAIDAALTSRRLGAKEIHLACLETREEMPAHEWECQDALIEGIVFHTSWGPKRILGDGDGVAGIELMRCTSVFDNQGRFNPSYDLSVTETLDADTVILAIGQAPDLSFLQEDDLELTPGGLIRVNGETMETSMKGVFAGGDVAKMTGSVVDAIASGRRAAAAIDQYLGRGGNIDESLFERSGPNHRLGRDEGFADWRRVMAPCLLPEERKGFSQIELGYDDVMAAEEAKRCLQCDLRLRFSPVVLPPEKWREFNEENVGAVPDTEGVFQLLDEEKNIIHIKGAMNMRQALEEHLGANEKARYFYFEEDQMYTKRESELLQQFLQQHGKMPGGDEELDDLF